MPRPRESPYVWVTWLARLLAGEASCEWASWFRSHHQDWAKPPTDFDSTQWMLDHTALVNQARESREKLGYTVFTEGQNSFPAPGEGRDPGREAGPDRGQGPGRRDHRREDREAQSGPPAPKS